LSGKPVEIVVSLASLADVFLHISIGFMEPNVLQDSLVAVKTSVHGLNGHFPLLAISKLSILVTLEA
jgi:hypothetical protein